MSRSVSRVPGASRPWLRAVLVTAAIVAAGAAYLQWERMRIFPVPILMYHRIGDGHDSPWWVTPSDFETHLRFLRESGYRSILPSDLAAHARWGKPLPPKPVILTFDDGFLNNLTTAEPLLQRYGFRAVVYLITAQIAERPEDRRTFEETACLTWPEIAAMRRRGTFAFGGHTHDHVNLAAESDPMPQIRECYRQMKQHLGRRPDSFCYPYGQSNAAAVEAVRRRGFTTGMLCQDSVAMAGPAMKRLELPRVSVCGGLFSFKVAPLPRPSASDALAFRIEKTGPELDVRPRLTGGNLPAAGIWLAEVKLKDEPAECRSPIPAGFKGGDCRLELWDRNRVLRLFTSERFSL